MKIYKAELIDQEQRASLCRRQWTQDESVRSSVERICLDVKRRGDEALKEYSARFDTAPVSEFRVTPEEIAAARRSTSNEIVTAITHAADNIRAFHKSQMKKEGRVETDSGVVCWREQRAIENVGLYIPAGSAPLPSTVLMLGVPATLAGCRRVPHVDANVHLGEFSLSSMYLLEIEGKTDCSTGGLEGEKTSISRPVNDASVIGLGELLDMVSVAGDQFATNLFRSSR